MPAVASPASGDLSSAAILTDASPNAYLAQTFVPGSGLNFQVFMTTNVDSGGGQFGAGAFPIKPKDF